LLSFVDSCLHWSADFFKLITAVARGRCCKLSAVWVNHRIGTHWKYLSPRRSPSLLMQMYSCNLPKKNSALAAKRTGCQAPSLPSALAAKRPCCQAPSLPSTLAAKRPRCQAPSLPSALAAKRPRCQAPSLTSQQGVTVLYQLCWIHFFWHCTCWITLTAKSQCSRSRPMQPQPPPRH
jgi:hypothetical protein